MSGTYNMFNNYADVVSVNDVMKMLGVGKSTVYALLQTSQIRHIMVGRKYIVPKQSVIDFVNGVCFNSVNQ